MVHGVAEAARLSRLRIRPAARAIVLDPDDRILLVRFEFPAASLWATPGGGVESGETHEQAIARELAEETGRTDVAVGPCVWTRLHIVPFIGGQWDGQRERYHVVRTPSFTPRPQLSWEELNREYVFELRWWTLEELEQADVVFAPRRLPELVGSLIREGPPSVPLDVSD